MARPLTAAQMVKKTVTQVPPPHDNAPDVPAAVHDAPLPPILDPYDMEPESEEELEEAHEPVPEPQCPARMRRGRGDDGAFPDIRKDAAVAEARAAEGRAKERRAEAKTRRATVEEIDEDLDEEEERAEEEELAAYAADDAQYEYWAFSAFSEEWRQAYEAELDSIKLHGVYELVPRESVPAGRRIIRSRPVFKIKRGSDGDIQHPVLNPSEWSCTLARPLTTKLIMSTLRQPSTMACLRRRYGRSSRRGSRCQGRRTGCGS
ncbi:hypothetical protein DFH06DRAFT_1204990 [Mycena polygramma]|nr:hypothetical protein DFH06DRAFT_1204990 [Mycena polygramma]